MNNSRSVTGLAILSAFVLGAIVRGQSANQPQQDATAKEIRAERFTLVDGAGRVRASLEMAPHPQVPGALPPGPSFVLNDQEGKPRMSLRLQQDDPSIEFRDAQERVRFDVLSIGSPYNGSARMRFFDGSKQADRSLGQLRLHIGESQISLFDSADRERISISMTQGLLDQRTGELSSMAPQPFIKISDEQGQTRASLGFTMLNNTVTGELTQSNASLVLFDKNGRVLFKVP